MIEGENDVDHLLENCEPPACISNSTKASSESSVCHPDSNMSENPDSAKNLDKHKIPSSIIVLNDEDKKRLEYVLLQIGLREVGLG